MLDGRTRRKAPESRPFCLHGWTKGYVVGGPCTEQIDLRCTQNYNVPPSATCRHNVRKKGKSWSKQQLNDYWWDWWASGVIWWRCFDSSSWKIFRKKEWSRPGSNQGPRWQLSHASDFYTTQPLTLPTAHNMIWLLYFRTNIYYSSKELPTKW